VNHIAEFLSFAHYLGVEHAEIQRDRRQPRLVGQFGGHRIVFAFPGTPSDHCSMINARSSLRRKLGLTHGIAGFVTSSRERREMRH